MYNRLILNYFPYKLQNMKSIPKNNWIEISEDAARQYIDARSVFTAYEEASRAAVEVRGGMYWKAQGRKDYLIRTSTSTRNSQKSLGPRSAETETIYQKKLRLDTVRGEPVEP
jgi:hypothetical protein